MEKLYRNDLASAETKNLHYNGAPDKRFNKRLSGDISRCLDELGFSRLHRWMRIHHMNIESKMNDLSVKYRIKTKNERLYVGSQREGLGLTRLSDLDVLQIDHNVICTQGDLSYFKDNKIALKIIDSSTSPGYCLLQVDKSVLDDPIFRRYKYAVVGHNGNDYLSSKMYVTKLDDDKLKASESSKMNTVYYPQKGPSTPKCFKQADLNTFFRFIRPQFALVDFNQHCDFVRALPCDEHNRLNTWKDRKRNYNWPSKKIIQTIMNLPVYVVPVGQTGSINEDIEWRISFILAELKLVQSFNNVQSKIFVLLKLIAKHYLRIDSDVISSYVIKNIMLWMAEKLPQKKFRQKHLMARMMDALQILKETIKKKTLPSYMHPERNLFVNKLNDQEEHILLQRISKLECEGPKILFDILYNEQPCLYVSRCAIDIMEELELYEFITTVHMLRFAKLDLSQRLQYTIINDKLKFVEEQIIHRLKCVNWRLVFQFDSINYKYYSDKLIAANKDLRKRSDEDIRPGRLDSMCYALIVFMIILLALVPRSIRAKFSVIYDILAITCYFFLLFICLVVTSTFYRIILASPHCMFR